MNFGPHTHLELSGPSFELITIFENFVKNRQKLSYIWGGGQFGVENKPNF